MQLVKEQQKISIDELKQMSTNTFGTLVKAVVDVKQNIMMVDAELHADQEEALLASGSEQENVWGISLYPDKLPDEGWIEFDSMINLRPSQANRTRSVNDPHMQQKIRDLVAILVQI